MQKRFTFFICCLALCFTAAAQSYLPKSGGELIEHTYYSLSYSEEHEQAEWVYYTLSPASLSGGASRKDDFRVDPKVSTQSATLEDYRGSGYDRGHLCPAASMSRSDDAISESFFMSNMSPQVSSFNRGVWKRLEEHVRALALRDSLLHVVTGPIFSDPIGAIGANSVTVPSSYYKVIYSPKRGEMLGYVVHNSKSDAALDSFLVTVDYVEEISGVDFFAEQNDSLSRQESAVNLMKWVEDLSLGQPSSLPVSSEEASAAAASASSQQCEAKTASGSQCTRKAQSGSKYCWQHQR